MKNRIVSSLLLVSLSVGLAACGGSGADSTTAEVVTEVEESEEKTEEAETEVPEDTTAEDDFVMPEYRMAVFENTDDRITLAIQFDAHVSGGIVQYLVNEKDEKISTNNDLLVEYICNEDQIKTVEEELAEKGRITTASNIQYSNDTATTLVYRFELSEPVDTENLRLKYTDFRYHELGESERQELEGEAYLTPNAEPEDLVYSTGITVGSPIFCEDGYYYVMDYGTGLASGNSERNNYGGYSANFLALTSETGTIHLADVTLMDSRTMEPFEFPEDFELYLDGTYREEGEVSAGNDIRIIYGMICNSVSVDELMDYWKSVRDYIYLQYETDNGPVFFMNE